MRKRSKLYDLVKEGVEFNRLTVAGPVFPIRGTLKASGKAKLFCVFQCECGQHDVHNVRDVTRGFIMSCGCHRVAVGRTLGLNNVTHGGTGTNLYDRWHLMNLRCYDPGQESYPDYGGRGIGVCDEWRRDFPAFRDWAMANGYRPELQIDRINNELGYSPDNCHWVTCKVNNNNRRSSVFEDFHGERKTIKQWSEDARCVVTYVTLWNRRKDGWDFAKALSTPPLPRGLARRFRIIP